MHVHLQRNKGFWYVSHPFQDSNEWFRAQSLWQVEWVQAHSNASRVMALWIRVSKPSFRRKGVNDSPLNLEMESLKRIIRSEYQPHVTNYQHDVIIHGTDNELDSSHVERVLHSYHAQDMGCRTIDHSLKCPHACSFGAPDEVSREFTCRFKMNFTSELQETACTRECCGTFELSHNDRNTLTRISPKRLSSVDILPIPRSLSNETAHRLIRATGLPLGLFFYYICDIPSVVVKLDGQPAWFPLKYSRGTDVDLLTTVSNLATLQQRTLNFFSSFAFGFDLVLGGATPGEFKLRLHRDGGLYLQIHIQTSVGRLEGEEVSKIVQRRVIVGQLPNFCMHIATHSDQHLVRLADCRLYRLKGDLPLNKKILCEIAEEREWQESAKHRMQYDSCWGIPGMMDELFDKIRWTMTVTVTQSLEPTTSVFGNASSFNAWLQELKEEAFPKTEVVLSPTEHLEIEGKEATRKILQLTPNISASVSKFCRENRGSDGCVPSILQYMSATSQKRGVDKIFQHWNDKGYRIKLVICAHTCTCAHTHMLVCMSTRMHAHMFACMLTCVHVCMHICTHACTHECKHTCTCAWIHAFKCGRS